MVLDQVIVEYNSEILKHLTNMGLEFKIALMYSDLFKAPDPSKLNKKRSLGRMLEL